MCGRNEVNRNEMKLTETAKVYNFITVYCVNCIFVALNTPLRRVLT